MSETEPNTMTETKDKLQAAFHTMHQFRKIFDRMEHIERLADQFDMQLEDAIGDLKRMETSMDDSTWNQINQIKGSLETLRLKMSEGCEQLHSRKNLAKRKNNESCEKDGKVGKKVRKNKK